MNILVQNYVKELKKHIGKQSRVLEVGSHNVNGGVRQFFKDADEYIGIDPFAGKDVDLVASSYDIPKFFKKESFDCVICCEMLEHDPYPDWSLQNMKNVLKPGGWLIISSPGLAQDLHKAPNDYYRFMPDAYLHVFFNGYENGNLAVGFTKGYPIPKDPKDIKYTKVVTIIGYGQKPNEKKKK